MMREEFYHSQYGDPDHNMSTRIHPDYDEGVEYIEAEGEEIKHREAEGNADAHESFLWSLAHCESTASEDDDDNCDM